jgi:hypothetical protein
VRLDSALSIGLPLEVIGRPGLGFDVKITLNLALECAPGEEKRSQRFHVLTNRKAQPIGGRAGRKPLRWVQAWIELPRELPRDELMADWEMAILSELSGKINPL